MSDTNIDLGVYELTDDAPVINIDDESAPSKSVNFGGGLEFLMNDKVKKNSTSQPTSDIDMNDLDDLENDLNELTDDLDNNSNTKSSFQKTYSYKNDNDNDSGIKLKFDDDDNNNSYKNSENKPSLASSSNTKPDSTWDGYKKFNDIPIDPNVNIKKEVKMSSEEKNRKKFEYLRKLDVLKKKGVQLSKEYNMESSLEEIQGEYESIIADKERHNSIKFQGKMMMAMVTGLEYLNNKFDPFDLKLDGWAESIGENIDDYDDIFSELHEKYKSKAKMAPELKLLFQLGGSAVMLHMTNTMFKSAMPGMEDIMRQNPELMQQFTQAAVNSMGQNNPGFGNFMNGMMDGQGQGQGQRQSQSQGQYQRQTNNYRENTMSPMGAPPGPRQPSYEDQPKYPPGAPSSRPDVGMSRGIPQFNDAEDISENYENMNGNYKRIHTEQQRAEMKGPSDIGELLSGLKPKNTQKSQSTLRKPGGSVISIDELESIQKDADNVPRKTKRKPRSEKNTVSLDI